jgi:DHA1 family tetracycline resistance protein-like MFS transporter
MAKNLLTFGFASKLGAMTDIKGRKPLILVSLAVGILPMLVFAAQTLVMSHITSLEVPPSEDSSLVHWTLWLPSVYFMVNALTGPVQFMAVLLAACADLTPPGPSRAVVFGVVLALFLGGIACAPFVSEIIGNINVTVIFASIVAAVVVPLLIIFVVKETVTPQMAFEAKLQQERDSDPNATFFQWMMSPFTCMKILLRSSLFINLTLLVVFSTMAAEASQTLLLYYIVAPPLNFTDADNAKLMVMIGLTGIFAQGFLLKPAVACFGERRVLIFSGVVGAIHMACYSFATDKALMYVGASLVCFTMFSFPTISAIKSNNVSDSEQGLMQGAVYAAKSLAAAVGPALFTWIYNFTKDDEWRGSFWLAGVGLYGISAAFTVMLPEKYCNSHYAKEEAGRRKSKDVNTGDMSERLIRVVEGENARPSSIV